MPFEVGDRVTAVFENNTAGNAFPGRIAGVTQNPGSSNGRGVGHWFAEKGILAYYLFCCCLCHKGAYFYDIDYDDGRSEKKVPASLVTAA